MAKLTTCKDCGHQVSKNATQCPNCGAKIKRSSPILNIIVGIILFSIVWAMVKSCSSETPPQSTTTQNTAQPLTDNASVAQATPTEKPTTASNWRYDSDVDKMRGNTSYFANATSLNSANFQFPYQGESHLHIIIRNKGDGNNVMFSIDKGQFHCNYDGCEISVKFDNEAVKTYTVNEADAGKNDVVFLASGKDAFIKKLKTSKKVIIEAPFFQEPRTQFDFDTAGLEWEH